MKAKNTKLNSVDSLLNGIRLVKADESNTLINSALEVDQYQLHPTPLLTITQLSPALEEVERMLFSYVQHVAKSVPTADLFLAKTKSKGVVPTIGPAHLKPTWCGIWNNPPEWTTINGEKRLEVTIPPAVLGMGIDAIVASCAHQIVHYICNALEINDVGSNGRHNDTFATHASKFMLHCVKDTSSATRYTTPELNTSGKEWLKVQKFNPAKFVIFADYAEQVERKTGGETKQTEKSKRVEDNNKRVQEANKLAKSKASKFDKFMDQHVLAKCEVKAHNTRHGNVYVSKDKTSNGITSILCGVITNNKDQSQCAKPLKV